MAWQTFAPQQFASQQSVADVWFCSVALYARRISEEYAYVMQHGCFAQECRVGAQLGMSACHVEGQCCHILAMPHEDVAQRFVVGVVFIYECFRCH